jgi:hypothetical protein
MSARKKIILGETKLYGQSVYNNDYKAKRMGIVHSIIHIIVHRGILYYMQARPQNKIPSGARLKF